jgi:CRP-like cAMP-binding protein
MITTETLGGLELFEGLPEHALRTIAAMSEELSFAAGTVIFSPEQASQRIFLLLEGSVRLTVFASQLTEPMTVTMLTTPGQAFSFSSIVGRGYHNSSAEALSDIRAIAIPGQALMEYLAREPVVGFVVMTRVANLINRRLGALRKLLLETIIDLERPSSTTPEN